MCSLALIALPAMAHFCLILSDCISHLIGYILQTECNALKMRDPSCEHVYHFSAFFKIQILDAVLHNLNHALGKLDRCMIIY